MPYNSLAEALTELKPLNSIYFLVSSLSILSIMHTCKSRFQFLQSLYTLKSFLKGYLKHGRRMSSMKSTRSNTVGLK